MSRLRIGAIVGMLVFLHACNNEPNEHSGQREMDYLQSQFNQLVEIDRSRFYYEDSIFPDIRLNDTLNLSDLGSEYLYLRLSELHCQECIKDMALFINDHFREHKARVVILGQFQSERKMSIFLRRLNLLECIAFLVPEITGHDLERTQAPYAFLLKAENRLDNLWLPHYSLPELSDAYLQAMAAKLIK